jgi:hypothetical protein
MQLVPLRRGPRAPTRDLRRFLPTTREEMDARGWDALDILLVNGDAYVDHPAFGGALIGRFLEARGFQASAWSRSPTGAPPTTSRAWARRG